MTKCLEKISNLLLRHTYKLWKTLTRKGSPKIRTFSVYNQNEGFFCSLFFRENKNRLPINLQSNFLVYRMNEPVIESSQYYQENTYICTIFHKYVGSYRKLSVPNIWTKVGQAPLKHCDRKTFSNTNFLSSYYRVPKCKMNFKNLSSPHRHRATKNLVI